MSACLCLTFCQCQTAYSLGALLLAVPLPLPDNGFQVIVWSNRTTRQDISRNSPAPAVLLINVYNGKGSGLAVLMLASFSVQFYGDNSNAEEVVFWGSKDLQSPKFGSYFIKGGKVVGAFIESGSGDENDAMRKVAVQQPKAPSDLKEQGVSFATSL